MASVSNAKINIFYLIKDKMVALKYNKLDVLIKHGTVKYKNNSVKNVPKNFI
jgi:hypothetical protein